MYSDDDETNCLIEISRVGEGQSELGKEEDDEKCGIETQCFRGVKGIFSLF